MEFIRDLLWLWILGALGGAGYILWAVYVRGPVAASGGAVRPPQSITTRRTPGAPPVARPAGPSAASPAPARTAQPPVAEHQRRGSAPTVKLPAESATDRIRKPTGDEQAAADLFGDLSAAKAKADAAPPNIVPGPPQLAMPKDIAEKVQRLEERGFHVGTGKTDPPHPPAPLIPTQPKADAAAVADGEIPGQARSQTAELDDILKRIDAVLSESGSPASEATLTNQQGESHQTMPLPTVHTSPPTEKLDRKATDPNQQKLF